jgi:hypothetical protein
LFVETVPGNLDCFASLAMTICGCHCEQSEAISPRHACDLSFEAGFFEAGFFEAGFFEALAKKNSEEE